MAGTKRQITRTRTSYSCQNCRRRKVKCTKEQPRCSQCQKIDDSCVYDTAQHDDITQHDRTTTQNTNGRKRKQSPELTQEKVVHATVSSDASASPQVRVAAEDSSVHDEDPIVGREGLDGLTTRTSTHHNSDLTNAPEQRSLRDQSNNADADTESASAGAKAIMTILERLNSTGITNREIATELAALSRELDNGEATFGPVHDEISQTSKRVKTVKNLNSRSLDNTDPQPIPEYIVIPSEEQSNVMFRCWLSSVYCIFPLVDVKEAYRNYQQFHYWYTHRMDRGVSNPVLESMPLVFAIHYGGAVSMSIRAIRKWWPGASRQALLSISRANFLRSLQKSEPRNLDTIAAELMMSSMSRNECDEIQTAVRLAKIIAAARAAGIHRPSTTPAEKSADLYQRRLWREITSLDVRLSGSIDAPPMLSVDYYDMSMPSELKDTKVGQQSAIEYEHAVKEGKSPRAFVDDAFTNDRVSVVSVYNLVFKARAVMLSSVREIAGFTLGVHRMTKEDMLQMRQTLNSLDHDVKGFIEQIPCLGNPELEFEPVSNKPGQSVAMDHGALYGQTLTAFELDFFADGNPAMKLSDAPFVSQSKIAMSAFHSWARITMSLLLDQVHAYSYAPFLRNAKSKLWDVARQCALRHCHKYMRKYISLATKIELERFRWAWATMFQPMHSATLLLVDLYEQPHSREAPWSRSLIDQVLSLGDPKHGLIGGKDGLSYVQPLQEGGDRVCRLLRQLRSRAWQKAGLDPTVLWSEQDQIAVGAAKSVDAGGQFVQPVREDCIASGKSHDDWVKASPGALAYRQVMNLSNGEMQHPSPTEAAPEVAGASIYLHKASLVDTSVADKGLRRARADQPGLPQMPGPHAADDWHQVPKNLYDSLMDVGQLIQKIRNAQRATKAGLQTQINMPSVSDVQKPPAVPNRLSYASNSISENDYVTRSTTACNHRDYRTTQEVVRPDTGAPAYREMQDSLCDSQLVDDDDPYIHAIPPNTTNYRNVSHETTSFNRSPEAVQGIDIDQGTNSIGSTRVEPTQDMQFDLDFDWGEWDTVFRQFDETLIEQGMERYADMITHVLG